MRLRRLWPLGLLLAFEVITLIWGCVSRDLAGLWPFYVCGLVAFALTTFRAPAKLYGPIWGALILIAYGIYVGAQSVTVIAPFSMLPEGGASKLAFTGEMVADVIHDSFTSIARASLNQPSGLCAGRTDPSEIAVLREPTDITLSSDSLPSPNVEPLRPEIWHAPADVAPAEPAVLEVKGVSLAAISSTVRSILHSQRVISGTVMMQGANSIVLVARSSNGEGPWVTGAHEATRAGLKQAGCELGEKVLGDTNPNVLAEAYLNSGRGRDVVDLYEEHVTKATKYSAPALLLSSAGKMQSKDYVGAIADLTTASRKDSDPRIRESLALAYLGTGDFKSALTELDTVLRELPRSQRATNWYDHGLLYFLNKDYAKAVQAFQNAVASDPTDVKANYYLGASLDKSGRSQDASVAYQKALESEPTYPSDVAQIRLQLGNMLDEMGKWPQALVEYRATARHFESIVASDPSNSVPRFVLAVVLLRIATVQASHGLGDSGLAASEQAASALAEVLKASPEYAGARDYLARSYLIRGEMLFTHQKNDQAIEAADEAMITLAQQPPSTRQTTQWHILLTVVAILRGNAYLGLGEAEPAHNDAEAALNVLQTCLLRSSQNPRLRRSPNGKGRLTWFGATRPS